MLNDEIQSVVDAHESLTREGRHAVLATLLSVRGSAYRRVGARLLVCDDGRTFGSISGGCLEQDLLEQAFSLLENKNQSWRILRYAISDDADSVFGIGNGCQGELQVLLELLLPFQKSHSGILRESLSREEIDGQLFFCTLLPELEESEGFLLHLLMERKDNGALKVRDRLVSWNEPAIHESPGKINQIEPLLEEFLFLARTGSGFLADESGVLAGQFSFDGTVLDFFAHALPRQKELFIFGAGNDAVVLAEMACRLGYRVSVCDHRKAFARSERFPGANVFLVNPEDPLTFPPFTGKACFVVMSHNFIFDKHVLKALVGKRTDYLGILGPKKRTEKLMQGLPFDEEQVARIYAPAGLDIGAEGAQEIALSILCEIQSVLKNRPAGFLRKRVGPIHDLAIEIGRKISHAGEKDKVQCPLSRS